MDQTAGMCDLICDNLEAIPVLCDAMELKAQARRAISKMGRFERAAASSRAAKSRKTSPALAAEVPYAALGWKPKSQLRASFGASVLALSCTGKALEIEARLPV